MIIRPSNLTWSLVNPQVYARAYINLLFQTLSTTLGPTLLQRQARSQDLPHLTRNLAATSAGIRNGTGIIYPLQPLSLQPDVCIEVEATLPEPAALRRPDLQ